MPGPSITQSKITYTFILRSMTCVALVCTGAAEANCMQSFNVSTTKSVPTSIPIYGGMRCTDIEPLRVDLYVKMCRIVEDNCL